MLAREVRNRDRTAPDRALAAPAGPAGTGSFITAGSAEGQRASSPSCDQIAGPAEASADSAASGGLQPHVPWLSFSRSFSRGILSRTRGGAGAVEEESTMEDRSIVAEALTRRFGQQVAVDN